MVTIAKDIPNLAGSRTTREFPGISTAYKIDIFCGGERTDPGFAEVQKWRTRKKRTPRIRSLPLVNVQLLSPVNTIA
jgi:hypothetical protein